MHVVGPLDQLREHRGTVVRVGHHDVAMFRRGDRVYALDNVCMHTGGPLGEGDVEDGCVVCPWHGWRYRLDTGESPLNASVAVRTYRAWVEDGRVKVELPDDL